MYLYTKIVKKICNKNNLFYSLLVILLNSPLYAAQPNPSFNCQNNGLSPVEKMICQCDTLSSFDRLLNDFYTLLLENLPTSEKDNLKREQRKWLKKDRLEAFKAEEKIKREKADRIFFREMVDAYRERIEALCLKYKAVLKEALYSYLERPQIDEDFSKSIQRMFLASYFYQVFGEVETDGIYHPKMGYLVRQSDGTWLLAWNGAGWDTVTNRDGGCYSFKLIHPKERGIDPVEVEVKYRAQDSVFKDDQVQGYVYKVMDNKIIIASGGWPEYDDKDDSTFDPEVLMTYSFQPSPPLVKLDQYQEFPDKIERVRREIDENLKTVK